MPAPVARHYPRDDVSSVEVTDADPAIVSLAWTRESLRCEVEAFIETARQIASHAAQADASTDPDPLSSPAGEHASGGSGRAGALFLIHADELEVGDGFHARSCPGSAGSTGAF